MRIDKADSEEWKLSEGGEPVAIIRPWLGAYLVFRSGQSHERPLVCRTFLDALKMLTPPKPRRSARVYYRGMLRRRSANEDEPE